MSDPKPRRAARGDAPARDTAAPAETTIEPEAPAAEAGIAAAATAGAPANRVPDDAWTLLAAAQAALARGCEEAAVELSAMTQSGLAASTDAMIELLGARTLAEAVEINAGLARRGLDALSASAARLSEIGAKFLRDASQPFLAPPDRASTDTGRG